MSSPGSTGIPPVTYEKHPWDPRTFYASKSAIGRHTGPYEAAVVPAIASLDLSQVLDSESLAGVDEATRHLTRFDEYVAAKWGAGATEIAPMSSVLLRTESAASSQIENLTVGARQLALFELGESSAKNAKLVNSNVRSMEAALDLGQEISAQSILDIHARLLAGEDDQAGQLRRQQVWIGGSLVGPHLATFVPPHHARIEGSLDDFVSFCRRDDIPSLVQIAVAHAQFETIHPFTDGNGRTGRAIVQAMLKGSGLTRHATVPLSSGLLVDTSRYFAALTSFRKGAVRPIVEEFAQAAGFAATKGRLLVDDLDALRVQAASRIKARSDATVWRLNDSLLSQPVVNTGYVAAKFEVSKVAAQRAIDQLTEVGVLTESTSKVRYRVWQANEIITRLDDFGTRIRRTGDPEE